MKVSAMTMKLLLVAMALGTAWAVRGQFGHEHGAAWAGGIGVLTVLVLAKRADWYKKLPIIVALGAIGWGVGGMMSYGMVVGYGRGGDMLNVSYGLLSLFIIGGLYGFIGGGITGLSLASTHEKKVSWASLITQMVAGGYLIWGILIYQFEWLMTPPRSELWAACLGAALALGWYAYRNQYHNSLKVALFSGLGAGFGFAFGNFLQVVGSTTDIAFNWWNVMEYSLGFFGGLGMAYGIFAEKWSESAPPDPLANRLGWIFLAVLLPVINLIQAFDYEKLLGRAERTGVAAPGSLINFQYILIWGSLLVFGSFLLFYYRKKVKNVKSWSDQDGLLLCMLYLAWYIMLSNIMGANWLNGGDLKEYLYWANLLLIGLGISFSLKKNAEWSVSPPTFHLWYRYITGAVVIIFILSLILINVHTDLPGAQTRFVIWE
ncbi:hypothetical protein OKW21_001897 [Catalinimonas alkaloidigena]|uniref:hypothetical protein n=1 Tax=Catalinimonas alkaloidigena TaxID=1075417 RepID=UPI002405EF08|nr:hypothetical protein [Catalinimonas alkaloidigena]MDF9796634.1 hypothetical protein [Catalinimonas alkaloidigena]